MNLPSRRPLRTHLALPLAAALAACAGVPDVNVTAQAGVLVRCPGAAGAPTSTPSGG